MIPGLREIEVGGALGIVLNLCVWALVYGRLWVGVERSYARWRRRVP